MNVMVIFYTGTLHTQVKSSYFTSDLDLTVANCACISRYNTNLMKQFHETLSISSLFVGKFPVDIIIVIILFFFYCIFTLLLRPSG